MAVRSKLFPSDEELGKRDDDHRKKQRISTGWLPRGKAPIVRPKRVLALLVACFLTWVIVRSLTSDSDPTEGTRTPWTRTRPAVSPELPKRFAAEGKALEDADAPQGAPPEAAIKEEASDLPPQNFEGPVRFFYLASSLHSIARTNGHRPDNRNILFAASDLKSAADIIPLACEMASWKRNYVHMVLMGRDEIPLDEVMKLNGVDGESCDVYWHDARPDYAQYSTDARMEVSVAGALGHVDSFMHPQAVITANALNEDDFFARGIFRKTKELRMTHIELPTTKKLANIGWLTRLEAQALRAWHAATIDVLIQAPHDTSGSLIRLLLSLERADYGAFVPPRLTIEMPPKLNDETMIFLDNFRWPPHRYQENEPINQLALRRRIPNKHLSADEASTRFIESFYPSHTQDSHVLILSPQVELSPAYYHYLKYHLLEYKYSSNNSTDLFGISLESPQTKLDGHMPFKPPARTRSTQEEDPDPPITPYLWQAPNSNAALYFADKWIEFHSFLTRYYTAARHPTTQKHFRDRKKVVTRRLPAWTESLLDLMRARGYTMLYPNPSPGSPGGNAIAIVHKELSQVPEEWIFDRPGMHAEELAEPSADAVLGVPNDYLDGHTAATEGNALKVGRSLITSLLQVFPIAPSFARKPKGDLEAAAAHKAGVPSPALQLSQMPLMDYGGESLKQDDLELRAANAAIKYRMAGGGCSADESAEKEVFLGSADDLFCVGGDEYDDPIDDEDGNPSDEAIEDQNSQKQTSNSKAKAPSTATPADRQQARDQSDSEDVKSGPTDDDDDDGLTDMQRADLQKWKTKQRKETGEVPDAPKPRGTYTRAVTDEDAKATGATGDDRRNLPHQDPDDLRDIPPAQDPDDHRPPDQRPRKVTDAAGAAAAPPTNTEPGAPGARPAPTDAKPPGTTTLPPDPVTSTPVESDAPPNTHDKERDTTSSNSKNKPNNPPPAKAGAASPPQQQKILPVPAVEELKASTNQRTHPPTANDAADAKEKAAAAAIRKSKEDDRSHESGTNYKPPVVDAAAYGASDVEAVPRGERVRASERGGSGGGSTVAGADTAETHRGTAKEASSPAQAKDSTKSAPVDAKTDADADADAVTRRRLVQQQKSKETTARIDQRLEALIKQKEDQQRRLHAEMTPGNEGSSKSTSSSSSSSSSTTTKNNNNNKADDEDDEDSEDPEKSKARRDRMRKQRVVDPDMMERMRQLERAEQMMAR